MELTSRWALRSKKYFEEHKNKAPWHSEDPVWLGHSCPRAADKNARPTPPNETQALFGIVQGGMDAEMRKESAERTVEIDFPGYAIGGLSGGQTRRPTPQ